MNNIRLLSFILALCMACGVWGQEIEWYPSQTCNEGIIENGKTFEVTNGKVKLEITIEKIPELSDATATEYTQGKLIIGRDTRVFLKIQDGYVMDDIRFYCADGYYKNIYTREITGRLNGTMSWENKNNKKYSWWRSTTSNVGPVNRIIFETRCENSDNVHTFALSYLYVKYEAASTISDSKEADNKEKIKIGSSGYCTYYTTSRYFMPAGCTGYLVGKSASSTDGNIKLELLRQYPSGTMVEKKRALLIKGTPPIDGTQYTTYVLYTNTKTKEQMIDPNLDRRNLLSGDYTETTHPTADETADGQQGLYYQFSYDSAGENLGFYWQQEGGTSITNGANKCYLFLPGASSGSTKVRGFCLDDMQEEDETGEATMITAAPYGNSPLSSAIYNIQGQQVDATFKGIVIKDGKKYYNK